MSNVPVSDANGNARKVDTFARTEGADVVETQAVAIVEPASGTPIDFATQTTVAALLVSANAIKVAAEALNAKAIALDTGSVGGSVAVSNMVAQGLTDGQLRASPVPVSMSNTPALTDTQLRASAVPISAASLPLPTGAGTEATLAALQTLVTTLTGSIGLHNAPFVDGAPGQVMLGKRRDSDTTTVADGDLNTFNLDEEGRLKVAAKPASYAPITGSVTSATSTIPTNVERFSNLMVHCTGTFAGVNCTFEGSLDSKNGTDGAWFAVQAIRSSSNTVDITTGVLSAAPAYAWELSVNAQKYFRIRATAWTSGTQVWTMMPGTYATEPIPAAQVSATQPVLLVANSLLIGDVGTQYRTTSTGAASSAHILSAATTNATIIKASAGRLIGWALANTNAAWRHVKLHNSATLPTAGAGVVRTISIPPNGSRELSFSGGVGFSAGIGMTIVTGSADNDTTAVGVGDVVGDIYFA